MDTAPRIERDGQGRPQVVWLSARDGQGLELLREAIGEWLAEDILDIRLTLTPEQGRLRAALHELQAVREESFDEGGRTILEIRLPRGSLCR